MKASRFRFLLEPEGARVRSGRPRRRLAVAALGVFALVTVFAPRAAADVRLRLFGQLNFMAGSGSDDGYLEGENEFPIVDPHRTQGFGLALTAGSGLLFYGAEIQLNLAGSAILNDPSDGDTVEVDTSRHAAALLIIGVNMVRTPGLRIFLEGGGGFAMTLDKDMRTYTSTYGFETEIAPPDREFPLVFFAGGGVEVPFSQRLALFLGGRYRTMNFHDPQSAILMRAGLSLSF